MVVLMPGIFDQATINQVQQASDIVDVIGEHVSLRKKGKEMVGLCPFHDDHRPSMHVSPVKQIFKCFACGAGGGVFTFVQMRENLTFPQAVERLAERAGIRLQPVKPAKRRERDQSPEVDPNQLARVNEWAAKYFEKRLYSEHGEAARAYIAERQITRETAKKWRLGLATDSSNDLIKSAKERGIPRGLLEQAGLITAQSQDKFVNRLMFPITDVTGRVIGFGGRTLGEAGAKYINSPTTVLFDKSNSLYGLEQARHWIVSTSAAVVVEGYTDTIMAHQLGCTNVVATLGTSLTEGHGRALRRYAKKVVLVFDSDTAGIEAANRALQVCLSQRIDIKLASVPEGKDPCDFLLAAGKDRFEQLVDQAVDVFEFKWKRLLESFGGDDTLAGRRLAVDEYLQTVAVGMWAGNLPAVDRGLLVNRLSRIIALDSKQINAELTRRIKTVGRAADRDSGAKAVYSVDWGQGLSAAAQREILEVLLNEPGLYKVAGRTITAEVFDVPVLRQIAAILFETLSCQSDVTLQTLLAKAESVEVGNCLAALAEAGERKGNFESRLAGALEVLQRCQGRGSGGEVPPKQDQSAFAQRVCGDAGRGNRHSLGMV